MPNVGQTFLYKILYFCDFDYYEKFEEQLTGAKYVKNHFGPTPHLLFFKKIIAELQKENKIEVVSTQYFNKDQTKYLPKVSADLSVINGQELRHIDEEINRFKDKSAIWFSEFSHKDVPWIIKNIGEVLEYESVFYRTPETSVRQYNDSE